MKRHARTIILPATAILLLVLGGCSSEPSADDIEKALKANTEQAVQKAKSLGMENMFNITLHAVKKLGCSPAQGEAGYNCDVEMDATLPLAGRTKNVAKVRLVKGSDGWVVAAQ